MTEEKHVPQDMLVEWNQNTFITSTPLDIPMVQVPVTTTLMPPQPVYGKFGSKSTLTLRY